MKMPAVQIRLVKTPTDVQNDDAYVALHPTPDEVAEYATIAAYWAKRGAYGTAALYTFVKVVDTASKIAVVAAQAKL